MIARRWLIAGIAAGGLTLVARAEFAIAACSTCARPDPKRFGKGDLLWPKNPQRLIPYSGNDDLVESDEKQWIKQRNGLIAELQATTPLSPDLARLLDHLKAATFHDFKNSYYEGVNPGTMVPHGGSAADPREHVGHVAIIDLDERQRPWVIEAIGTGVQRIRYADWISRRSCESVWHGRIKPLSTAQRQAFATEAARQVGKPYSLFNSIASFNLYDTRNFYCSKLVWYSLHKTAGLALDDNEIPTRLWPVSPRQLIESRNIEVIHSCGSYRERQQ